MTLPRPAARAVPRAAVQGLLTATAGALVGWLMYLGVSAHYERACAVRDTPYLPLCDAPDRKTDPQQLRDHLARNPGDSTVWVALAIAESGAAQQSLLPALAALAPSNGNGLRLRASDALAQNQPELAVKLLVQMTEHGVSPEAPRILARLIAGGPGAALVRPYLVAGSNWLPKVLASLSALKLPLERAFPLLVEAATQRIVAPDTIRAFVRSLKAERKWADAYGLWAAQQHQPVPVLFNGSFDRDFQPDGFDWELTPAAPGRAGAVVTQPTVRGQGTVLEVRYTGLATAAPIVRQYLFISPGRYSLQGRYMGSRLRSEEGVAWAVRCLGDGGALAGRSAGLQDTKGAWIGFSFDFEVPRDCGLVASLQLETFAPYEAAAGIRGTAAFDDFKLRQNK